MVHVPNTDGGGKINDIKVPVQTVNQPLSSTGNEDASIFEMYESFSQHQNKYDLDDDNWEVIEPQENKFLFVSTGGYTYTAPDGTTIKVDDIEDVIITHNSKTGELLVIGAQNAVIEGGNTAANITVFDSVVKSIKTGKEDDTVSLYNTTVNKSIDTNNGNDTVKILENSKINGSLNTGNGNDNILVNNSEVKVNINSGAGNDTINILNKSKVQNVFGQAGDDKIYISNSNIKNMADSGNGNDSITVNNSTIGALKGQAGDDKITVSKSEIGEIDGGDDNDTIKVENNSKVTNLYGGAYLGVGGLIKDDDNITVDKSTVDFLRADSGDDTINILNNSHIKKLEGNGGDDVINAKNSVIDSLYGGKDDDKITLTDMNVKELVDGGASVSFFGLFNGSDTTNVNNSKSEEVRADGDDTVNVTDSDVNNVTATGNNNNVNVDNSKADNVSSNGNNNNINITNNSEVGTLNSEGDNNTVAIDNSKVDTVNIDGDNNNSGVVNSEVTDVNIEGSNNAVTVENSDIGNISTGNEGASIYVDKDSNVNIEENENNTVGEIEEVTTDISIEALDSKAMETSQTISDNVFSKYTDRELTQEEQYYVLTIDSLAQNLENMKAQFEEQNAEDGIISKGYNFAKELTNLGVSAQDIEAAIKEQETMISEMISALNNEGDESFEDVYKKWTGVTYNQENVEEYLETSQMYSLAAAGLQKSAVFAQQVNSANSLEEVLNLYNSFYGEEKGREKLNAVLQEAFLNNPEAFGYPTSVEINDKNQLVVTRPDEYGAMGALEGTTYTTTVEDVADVTNMIKSMPRYFDISSTTVEDFKESFKKSTGYSIEALQSKYITSQSKTIGNANSFQKLVDKYCADQAGFIDKLSGAAQIAGIGMMVVGGVICIACPPAAGAGIALMNAGKYTSIAGMFGDNALSVIDDISSENGITKEEAFGVFKETLTEVALLYSGMKINGAAGSVKDIVLTETQNKVLAGLAEIGTDATLSLLTDLVITGEVDLSGEGISQILGIITGIAGAKVNDYKAKVQEEQLLKLGNDEITLDEAEVTLKGAGFSDKEIGAFKEGYSSGRFFDNLHNRFPSNSRSGVDYSNIVTTREPYTSITKGTKLDPNAPTKVSAGTVVEVGPTKVNLDDLNLKPGQTITIGRNGNYVINDSRVSRQHLEVTATESGYIIKDLASTNGTKIAFSPLVLRHGDGTYTIHKNISLETYRKLFDSCYSNSMQQRNGDCYLLSSINALYDNPYGRNAIINCFKETPDGKVEISLPNGKFKFDMDKVLAEVQKHPDQYSATNPGLQALEYAFGIERFNNLPTWKKVDEISNREGGLSKEVMEMFGFKCKETNISNMVKYLSDSRNWQDKDVVFTIATKRTPSGGGDDKFWYRDLDLAGNHMYMLQPRIQNGRIVVDIKNPWHSNQVSCTLTLEQVERLGCFDYFSITQVK